jgi:hypothetical protein
MSLKNNTSLENPELERRLDAVFSSYRDACPDPEPGPNFMPALWQSIDSRRTFALSFRRWARGLVTFAAAAAMLMAIFVSIPSSQVSPVYLATYVDVLDDDSSPDNAALAEIAHQDPAGESNIQ